MDMAVQRQQRLLPGQKLRDSLRSGPIPRTANIQVHTRRRHMNGINGFFHVCRPHQGFQFIFDGRQILGQGNPIFNIFPQLPFPWNRQVGRIGWGKQSPVYPFYIGLSNQKDNQPPGQNR
jgi:hypothetical protein